MLVLSAGTGRVVQYFAEHAPGAPPGGLVSGDDLDAWNVNLRYACGFGLSVGGYYEWHLEDEVRQRERYGA